MPEYIEAITTLLLEKDAQVQEIALLLADIQRALRNKTITKQEYDILLFDVEKLRGVIIQSDNAMVDILIHRAIEGVITLAKAVW